MESVVAAPDLKEGDVKSSPKGSSYEFMGSSDKDKLEFRIAKVKLAKLMKMRAMPIDGIPWATITKDQADVEIFRIYSSDVVVRDGRKVWEIPEGSNSLTAEELATVLEHPSEWVKFGSKNVARWVPVDENDILEMRRLWDGGTSIREICRLFGKSKSCIRDIVNRVSYRDIADE